MSFSDKYLSFKTSRMNPLAESTAIGSPMGLQQSPDSFRGNQKRKPISPLSQDNKQRQMKMHIEPHILTNAQSPGIVKRLISYYGESQGEADKNRYTYNRVGDFPLVQLKKNEIKRNLTRSPSVRIAPPNRTLMNRDLRAAIIRSNSFQLGSNVPKLMPTKMRAKDDLHQIITNHDPLPVSESAQSAKSVLDALEKNCRKRINNEELTLDRNKRVCATTQQEVVDAPSTREFMPITPQSSKRSRDQLSPTKTLGDSPYFQQKKKFRIRNNALLSSLSSSHFILKPQTLPSSPSLPSLPKPSTITLKETSKALNDIEKEDKQLKEAEKLTQKRSNESPPKPNAEKRLYLFNRKIDPSSYSLRIQDDDDDEIKINFVKPRETAPAHDNDIIRQADKEKLSMMLSGLSDGFNSPTKETQPDSVDSVPASLSFKTVTTASSVGPIVTTALTTSPLPLRTETNSTSSLAAVTKTVEATPKLTLPTIAAPSVTVAPKTTESEAPKTLLNFQFGAPAAEKPVVTNSATVPVLNVASTTVTPSLVTSTTTAIPSGKLSPLFGSSNEASSTQTASINSSQNLINFTPIAKSVNFTSASSLFPSNPTTTSVTSVAPILPAMNSSGAFSFGGSKETPKTTSSFSFGSNLGSTNSTSSNNLSAIPPNPVASASNLPTTSAPAFNIGAVTTPAFNFGANPSTNSNSAASLNILNKGTSGIASLTSNAISFGQKPETTTASGVGFSFSNQQTAVVSPTVPVTTAPAGFSFGSSNLLNTTQTTSPVATTNSFFGPSAASAPVASKVFGQPTSAPFAPSFGQPAAPASSTFPNFGPKAESTTSPSGMFSFGQKPTAAATPSSFSFGGNAPAVTTASSSFNFGQTNPIQSTTVAPAASGIFSRLGDKPEEAKSTFSFGGGQQQPQQAVISSPFGNTNNNNISQTSPPMFGSSNATFSQTPATNNMFANAPQSNGFGTSTNAAKPPAASGMFSFGGNNSQPQQAQPSAQPSGMFNFGGNAAPVQSSPPANLFGNNTTPNVSASFSFKASNGVVAAAPNAFGQNQGGSSAAPPAYQFGQPVGNNVSASYTFSGASANASSHSAPSNGFNFSGPQTAPAVTGAFNFQGQQQVLTPQPSPGGGMFNIGTGGNNQQQRRPIRQATRRMK